MADCNTHGGYVGRFAPSPTGPLHFGSLIAATGSFLQARSQDGQWLLRIEDLDPPREVAGAGDAILHALEAYGFQWDGEVSYQSARRQYYREALRALFDAGRAYRCGCSRKNVQALASSGRFGLIYPGTCRVRVAGGKRGRVVRVITHDQPIGFEDPIAGRYSQCLESEVGDFIVKRGDGLIAYQLAVVVDDARQGVTEVVRGSDLLDSTPRQIYLQKLLELATPRYAHLPVAVNARGAKLSKQTHARALPPTTPQPVIVAALTFLNQAPPAALTHASLDELWDWAIANWSLDRVPRELTIEYSAGATALDLTSRKGEANGQTALARTPEAPARPAVKRYE